MSAAGTARETARETSARGLLFTLIALLALAGFSLAMRFAHLGAAGYVVGLGIALVKAVLVVVFFMELLTEKATARIAFVVCLSLFALLLAFVLADIVTRGVPPLRSPAGTAERARG
ncbi:MAG TPA: cytochrome C oxidase subunit IV family protein [Polyangiaceae bacterium]|jgi:cytochrome c oxidase subunit 4